MCAHDRQAGQSYLQFGLSDDDHGKTLKSIEQAAERYVISASQVAMLIRNKAYRTRTYTVQNVASDLFDAICALRGVGDPIGENTIRELSGAAHAFNNQHMLLITDLSFRYFNGASVSMFRDKVVENLRSEGRGNARGDVP
jgi:hypothetical protein